MRAADALHDGPLDAGEEAVDAAGVQPEILFENIVKATLFFVGGHVSIPFFIRDWGFLILQLAEHMHQKLMAIMLHRRVKLLTDQVLKTRRVQYLFLGRILSVEFCEEFAYCPGVAI